MQRRKFISIGLGGICLGASTLSFPRLGKAQFVNEVKMVVIGADAVGKTSLIMRYTTDYFSIDGYRPDVYDEYSMNVAETDYSGMVNLHILDTAGNAEKDRERILSYPSTNIFLVCYSIENKTSFDLARDKFISEAAAITPDAKMVLVACKTDLRSSGQGSISTEDGRNLAHQVNAFDFIECSSLSGNNVKEVFLKPLRMKTIP